ncbi:MAG TPA: APC family permease [Chloroflexota bacterium]|nr:APC family permease [Chloroflexota bacterium]
MPTELSPDAQVLAEERGAEHLRRGALTLFDGTVIGVASTAPAYSLTATLALLIGSAGVGLFAPSAMLIAFLPMLGVAVGFYWLNRRIPNCGASYAWVARALHPAIGFLTGWVIVMADVIVMISLAGVAAASTLTLFGQDASNKTWNLVLGIAWIVIMTWIVLRGIRLSAMTQWVLLALEYVIVMGFCLWAIIDVYANHPKGSHVPSLNWLLPWQAPGGGPVMLTAVLAAVFIYWGWDTAANVNEETEDATHAPGLATVLSTFVLLIIYLFAAFATAAYFTPSAADNNSSDVLTYMAQSLTGSGNKLWYLMVLAVISSAASSTQTTILPTARVTFSMARDRIIPRIFAAVHSEYLTPWFSTIIMGAVSIAVYVISLYASGGVGQAIQNAILAIGLLIAFYYGLTGIAAAWYYRRLLFTSLGNFVFAGIFPLAGGLGFFYIFVEAARGLTVAQFWTGVGSILIGVPLLAWSWIHNPAFYRQPTEVAGPEEPMGGASAVSVTP